MAAFTAKRAPRCPLPGWGWLYLREHDAEALESGAPQQQHPDHHQSGPNPAWIEHGTDRLQTFIRDPHYKPQIEARMAELEKERAMTTGSLHAAISDLERIEANLALLSELMP